MSEDLLGGSVVDLPKLNFPVTYAFEIQMEEEKAMVLDPLRRKFVRLTPEEWVRLHLVQYLIQTLGYPEGLTAIETGFIYQGMQCRADVLVHARNGKPVLMGECKAPDIKLKQNVFDQIGRYNTSLKANYLLVTNGITHFCCEIDREKGSYEFLESVPKYTDLNFE